MEMSKEGRLLAVAYQEFLKHGYGRVKMHDVAKLAGMSRAALYLLFSSKEELFKRLFADQLTGLLEKIRAATESAADPPAKLRVAIELWAASNFDLIKQSPEASELLDMGLEFSREVFEQKFRDFEALLATLLPMNTPVEPCLLAHILGSSLRGLKKTARDASELRTLIAGLLDQCRL